MSAREGPVDEGREPEDSPPVPGVAYLVPIEMFRSQAVTGAISTINQVDVRRAGTPLASAATAARDSSEPGADALQVLSGIASYHFVPENRLAPFQPMMTFGDRRTLIPDDLLAEQIEVLAAFSPEISNPALRGRVSDVCWLRVPTNADAGMRAVAAYVECISLVICGKAEFSFGEKNLACVTACDLLRRATIIARRMGWERTEFNPLRTIIADVSQMASDTNDAWGFIHIAPINLDNCIWEGKAIAERAERLAKHGNITDDFTAQRALWELAARAYRHEKDSDNENRCLIAAAETHVGNADARSDSAIVQAAFLDSAIQALRPIPGTAERRRELQDRLNAVQARTRDEMSTFSHEQDITELVEAVEAYVSGKSLPDAIRTCFTCEQSPDPETLRNQVLEHANTSISSIIPITISDHQGRTRFKAPGLIPEGPPDEDQVQFLINQQDQFRRQLVVSGRINVIRRAIMQEHFVPFASLLSIMVYSPFVPPDHELIFAKGAMRFLAGDDIEAAHLILPQLENSLRHILSLSGVETNRMNQDGTQEEATLGRLLENYREPLLALIPAALLQEVDLLFHFRGGPSVRHELAHGKMNDRDFWRTDVTYSTWLVLRMAFLPTLSVWSDLAAEIERTGGL